MKKFRRKISDPIHKVIELTEKEDSLIQTKAFQRLRNIKQLGLVYYVFPAADYSRFSHSIGVCHTTGKILNSLLENQDIELSEYQFNLYRIAGLLHDIGHYPFSHTMENAIKQFYAEKIIKPKNETEENENPYIQTGIKHEDVGKKIILYDEELNKALRDSEIKPEEIYPIFKREKVILEDPLFRYTNIISSDLDADRIDYLLRSSHVTAAPYGITDIHYFLNQLRVDENFKICINFKALKTADHFLLARYFDYQQVIYHKTVAGLEMVLADLIKVLLDAEEIRCDEETITELIKQGEWYKFDDNFIIEKIRNLVKRNDNPIIKRKADSILYRIPPKLIANTEYLDESRNEDIIKAFKLKVRSIKDKIEYWADKFKIDKGLWYLQSIPDKQITKVGSRVPISHIKEIDEIESEQSVRVYYGKGQDSKLLQEVNSSLMSILSNQSIYTIRLYLLFPENEENKREGITKCVKEDLPEIFDH